MNSFGFELGDSVEWDSQAAGRWKTKQGVVVRVLGEYEAFTDKDRADFPNLFRGSGVGMPRKGKSYVVAVGKAPFKFYWPNANKLRLVGREVAEAGA